MTSVSEFMSAAPARLEGNTPWAPVRGRAPAGRHPARQRQSRGTCSGTSARPSWACRATGRWSGSSPGSRSPTTSSTRGRRSSAPPCTPGSPTRSPPPTRGCRLPAVAGRAAGRAAPGPLRYRRPVRRPGIGRGRSQMPRRIVSMAKVRSKKGPADQVRHSAPALRQGLPQSRAAGDARRAGRLPPHGHRPSTVSTSGNAPRGRRTTRSSRRCSRSPTDARKWQKNWCSTERHLSLTFPLQLTTTSASSARSTAPSPSDDNGPGCPGSGN
jgi:hypothetical protein